MYCTIAAHRDEHIGVTVQNVCGKAAAESVPMTMLWRRVDSRLR
jgi:hypothetical protein